MTDAEVAPHISINAAHWEDVFESYPLESLIPADGRIGETTLPRSQLAGIGQIDGLTGVHLQCGIGLDTVSLARMGANMTGVDISGHACEIARELAAHAKVNIQFLRADILSQSQLPTDRFDFVYTSDGILRWLPNLKDWAENVRSLLRAGGWLYLHEIHPLVYSLAHVDGSTFTLAGDYFDESVVLKSLSATHLGPAEMLTNRQVAHTNWTLGSIVQSLIDAGFRVDSLTEYPDCPYSRKGLLRVPVDNTWTSVGPPPMPLSFSIRATRV